MSGGVDRTIIWLTWRQLFARRRLYMAAVFSLTPLLVAGLFRIVVPDSESSSVDFLTGLIREFVIGTLLPLAAVVFGTSAFGGEVDDGTLVYLLAKPLPRWRVVVWKYVVAVLSTAAVMLPAVVLPWLAVRTADLPARVPLAYLAGLGVGCLLYCAIFLTLGLTTRRALVFGLLYIVAMEMVLSRSVIGTKSLSVREFSISVAQWAGEGAVTLAESVVSMTTVWTMGTVMLVGALALTMWRLRRYEVAERL
jgi:ABC-2 type transport system permease protein